MNEVLHFFIQHWERFRLREMVGIFSSSGIERSSSGGIARFVLVDGSIEGMYNVLDCNSSVLFRLLGFNANAALDNNGESCMLEVDLEGVSFPSVIRFGVVLRLRCGVSRDGR